MNLLILANVPVDETQQPAAAVGNAASDGSKCIVFSDPWRLIKTATVERMEIIMLLREMGPMTAESISSSLARDRVGVLRDLEVLLNLEILDVDRDASYLFGFDGLCVILQSSQSAPAGVPR
jgi:hypothetical protein